MTDYIESESFMDAEAVRDHVANLLKETKSVKSLVFETKGESLKDAKEFAKKVLSLRKRGVKVTHEFSIKLDFPSTISRQSVLDLIENMPKPVNGTAKVRVEVSGLSKDAKA